MKKIITACISAGNLKWAGKIDDQIKLLVELKERYGDGKLEFDVDHEGYVEIEYVYEREETDKEVEVRLAAVRDAEERERSQYERLKAKYGVSN